MRWSKKLNYGSLVCLSADGFKTNFLFASVVNRDYLETEAIIGLRLCDASLPETTSTYRMVESPAYFEAYKHVLSALQVLPSFIVFLLLLLPNLGFSILDEMVKNCHFRVILFMLRQILAFRGTY